MNNVAITTEFVKLPADKGFDKVDSDIYKGPGDWAVRISGEPLDASKGTIQVLMTRFNDLFVVLCWIKLSRNCVSRQICR